MWEKVALEKNVFSRSAPGMNRPLGRQRGAMRKKRKRENWCRRKILCLVAFLAEEMQTCSFESFSAVEPSGKCARTYLRFLPTPIAYEVAFGQTSCLYKSRGMNERTILFRRDSRRKVYSNRVGQIHLHHLFFFAGVFRFIFLFSSITFTIRHILRLNPTKIQRSTYLQTRLIYFV